MGSEFRAFLAENSRQLPRGFQLDVDIIRCAPLHHVSRLRYDFQGSSASYEVILVFRDQVRQRHRFSTGRRGERHPVAKLRTVLEVIDACQRLRHPSQLWVACDVCHPLPASQTSRSSRSPARNCSPVRTAMARLPKTSVFLPFTKEGARLCAPTKAMVHIEQGWSQSPDVIGQCLAGVVVAPAVDAAYFVQRVALHRSEFPARIAQRHAVDNLRTVGDAKQLVDPFLHHRV